MFENVHGALGIGQRHAVDLGHALNEDAFNERISEWAVKDPEVSAGAGRPAHLAEPAVNRDFDTPLPSLSLLMCFACFMACSVHRQPDAAGEQDFCISDFFNRLERGNVFCSFVPESSDSQLHRP